MKVCDMCKKEMPCNLFLAGHFPFVSVTIIESVCSGMQTVDLCNDCQLRVYNFIKEAERICRK